MRTRSIRALVCAALTLSSCTKDAAPAEGADDQVLYEDGTKGPYTLRPKSGGFEAQLPSRLAIRFDVLLPQPLARGVFWYAGSPECELVTLASPGRCAEEVHVLAGYLESDSSFEIRRAAEVAAGFIKQVAGANVESIDLGPTTAVLTFRAKELGGMLRYEARGQRLYQLLVFSPSAQPVAWAHFVDGLRATGARGSTAFPATYPDGDPLLLRGRGKRFRDLHDPVSFARRRPKTAVIDGQLSMLGLAEMLSLAPVESAQ